MFDLVGNRSLTDCRRALTPEGTLVLSGGGVSEGGSFVGPMALFIKASCCHASSITGCCQLTEQPSRENLAALRELVESGAVTPVVDRTYPLSDVPEAIRYLEVEHAQAKVVITV